MANQENMNKKPDDFNKSQYQDQGQKQSPGVTGNQSQGGTQRQGEGEIGTHREHLSDIDRKGVKKDTDMESGDFDKEQSSDLNKQGGDLKRQAG